MNFSQDALRSNPQEALNVAFQTYNQSNWVQTEHICRQVVAIWPEFAEALQLLSFALNGQMRREEGLIYMRQAVKLNPGNAGYRYNYAVSLHEDGRINESAMQYRECLRLNPLQFDALWNYGEYLRMEEHFQEALNCFETILSNGRHYPAIHHRMGVCYGSLKQYDKARESFALATHETQLSPAHLAMTPWEQALMELTVKNFKDGWALYERRFQTGGLNKVFCHDFGLPWWAGQALQNETLLVHGEQGLGDEMMFAALIPTLLKQLSNANNRLIIAVKPGLVRLFRLSFPQAMVVAHEVGNACADLSGLSVNYQCAIGSLPVLCGVDMAKFESKAYLRHDPELAQHYAGRLQSLMPGFDNTVKVGLMWGSAPNLGMDKHATWAQKRSINLGLLAPLGTIPGVSFVSLQNGERGAEAALAPNLNLIDLSSEQTDFYETAALIANLDLVISVDTSVGHLAGGMGARTWQPLMSRADWRHTLTSTHSYWYPDVKYIRQTTAGNWYPVIDTLHQQLTRLVQARSSTKA